MDLNERTSHLRGVAKTLHGRAARRHQLGGSGNMQTRAGQPKRTGTASLYTHLMVRNPREDAPRKQRWLRVPVAMREAVRGE